MQQRQQQLTIGIILALSVVASASSNPWCEYNVTSTKSATSFFQKAKKIFKKPEASWQLVRKCCDGFKLNEAKECEAVCEKACPLDTKCIAPNECQCRDGYVYVHGVGDEENHCKATCLPECGELEHCIRPNYCECLAEYVRNPKTRQCIAVHTAAEAEAAVEPETATEFMELLQTDSQQQTNIENIQQTTTAATIAKMHSTQIGNEAGGDADGDDQQSSNSEDANEPTTTLPNEELNIDCRLHGCHDNAVCLTNGTCVCLPGYTLYYGTLVNESDDTNDATVTEILCLNSDDLNERLNGLTASAGIDNNSETNWQLPLLIGLVVAACCVVFLVVACTIRQRQRSKMEVDAKNELCCEYDNKSFTQKQMVY